MREHEPGCLECNALRAKAEELEGDAATANNELGKAQEENAKLRTVLANFLSLTKTPWYSAKCDCERCSLTREAEKVLAERR